jgi:hypothetical protein
MIERSTSIWDPEAPTDLTVPVYMVKIGIEFIETFQDS